MTLKIPKRIARTLISSLKGGVVPRIGLPYITVGRKNEIDALLHDVDVIADGGASFRFIVGRYGSGKSFLLQTLRNYVMERISWWWTPTCPRNGGSRAPKDRDWPPTGNWSGTWPPGPVPKEAPCL